MLNKYSLINDWMNDSLPTHKNSATLIKSWGLDYVTDTCYSNDRKNTATPLYIDPS